MSTPDARPTRAWLFAILFLFGTAILTSFYAFTTPEGLTFQAVMKSMVISGAIMVAADLAATIIVRIVRRS